MQKINFIDVSQIPQFSVDKLKETKTSKRAVENKISKEEKLAKLIGLLVVLFTIGSIGGRVAQNVHFNSQLEKEHNKLDADLVQLIELKTQAFKNNNYKNPDFRKTYLALHKKALAEKKSHIYAQTNRVSNVFITHHGVCPECQKLKEMGVRAYE